MCVRYVNPIELYILSHSEAIYWKMFSYSIPDMISFINIFIIMLCGNCDI